MPLYRPSSVRMVVKKEEGRGCALLRPRPLCLIRPAYEIFSQNSIRVRAVAVFVVVAKNVDGGNRFENTYQRFFTVPPSTLLFASDSFITAIVRQFTIV
jgi:hypothetical protein